MKHQVCSSLLLFLTSIIWGLAFVAQSVGMEYVKPFTFNGMRCLIGGIVLIPCVFLVNWIQGKGREVQETKENKKILLVGGICCGGCLFLASNLQQIALQYVAVGKAGFLTAFYIVIVPLIGLFFKKKCSPFIWCSVGLSLLGLYLLCMKGSFSLEYADYLLLASAVLFAIHILVIDHFSPFVNGVKLSCLQFCVSGVLSIFLAILIESPGVTKIYEARFPLLYAGVLSCGVGYTLQIIGQRGMNPTVASLILSLESVVSVLAGWILLKQELSFREMMGCVVIFVAILLAQLPAKTKS